MPTRRMAWLSVVLMAVLLHFPASAQESIGIGVIVGDPTGISFRAPLSGRTAVAGAVAWSFGRNDSLRMHMDYLLFPSGRTWRRTVRPYYGIGGKVWLIEGNFSWEDDAWFGMRVPLGLDFQPGDALNFFVEIAPGLRLTPDTAFSLDGGIGVRYLF